MADVAFEDSDHFAAEGDDDCDPTTLEECLERHYERWMSAGCDAEAVIHEVGSVDIDGYVCEPRPTARMLAEAAIGAAHSRWSETLYVGDYVGDYMPDTIEEELHRKLEAAFEEAFRSAPTPLSRNGVRTIEPEEAIEILRESGYLRNPSAKETEP